MPKQGHFAKSSRLKHLNQFKVKQQNKVAQINKQDFTDYLLVRFALTAKKRVPQTSQETVQRFLIEISDHLLESHGDLATLLPALLQELNHRAPWQFYMEIIPEWDLVQDFLKKEVPAVPISPRCYITTTISQATITKQVGKLLANKAATITLLKHSGSNKQLQQQTAHLLLPAIMPEGKIDWAKVRMLLSPFPFQVDTSLDKGSQEWLTELSRR